jgi:uncharacterized membrane protein
MAAEAIDTATSTDMPAVRRIGLADLRTALAKGLDDFLASPTQLVFLCVIYPIVGLVMARAAAGEELLPLVWPIIAGFALVGPIAALGVYELSRRREQGLPVSWLHALEVRHSPAIGSIAALGLVLLGIFIAWLLVARGLYWATLGATPTSMGNFAQRLLDTPEGWTLILLGNAAGFVFAATVLVLTVVSFPLLLDRNVSLQTAIATSIRAVLENPVTMAAWGLIIAGALLLGALPLFAGLAVVLPVLGHATWHLYRRVVA